MKKTYQKGGFTLVELIVAVSVFITAMSIISGLFVKTLHTQKILGAVIESSSNTSLMIEQMSREIRLGFYFSASAVTCGPDLPDFSQSIAFKRLRGSTSTVVVYEWNTTKGTLDRTEEMGTTESITSANVAVSRLCFRVSQGGSTKNPWKVTIAANVSPRGEGLANKGSNLETTVSSRLLPSDLNVTKGVCLPGWSSRFPNLQCP